MAAPAPSLPSAVPQKSLYRIGEFSRLTETKAFVLRYWETEFPMLQPVKSPSGHRLYRREDIETVFEIKRLLYDEGFTIAGARRFLAGHPDAEGASQPNGQHSEGENLGANAIAHGPRAVAAPRKGSTSAQHRKFLLDLHQELLAVLTLLERE